MATPHSPAGAAHGAHTGASGTAAETSERSCGNCALCCSGVLSVTVLGHEIGRGKPCPFSSGTGCTIHATRPRICRNFQCGWLRAASPLPEAYRPDRVGFIVLASKFRWNHFPVDVAVAADDRYDAEARTWLENHCREKRRMLIFQSGRDITPYGPVQFRQEMEELIRRGGPLPW